MAALPYIQLYVADYLADTAHLTTIEHGAYLLLIFNYWQRGESFKAKDEQTLNRRLASVARMSNDEWTVSKEVLSEFFTISENEWSHDRIERDLEAVNSKSEKARNAGKASASARSKNKAPSENSANARSANVQQALNHTDTDTDTDTEKTEEVVKSLTTRNYVSERDSKPSAGELSAALRQLGVQSTSMNPILQGWIDQGVTIAEATQAVSIARHNKPLPEPIAVKYLDLVIASQRKASAPKLPPKPPDKSELRKQTTEAAKQRLFGNQEKDVTNEAARL